ncbi:hypothetical protein Lfu02_20810 [Longispora fulva]|uniref:DUF2516 family protein n=1 Tax=Longispora fulva TaxID=619741 RepID=A0A8J7KZ02_9ACTN|nr:DUF2516 family protein [Longispora fulva]MBG6139907.1 hypothetical protein [Longispora fulva]GIG57709.1 hypothetical protein Lfu02_20810 [Longispora fulva]
MSNLLPLGGPWVYSVIALVNLVIAIFAMIISAAALIHCVRQRADAFTAIGTLAKGPWMALLAGATLISLVTILAGVGSSAPGLFSMLAILASSVYLLDVRPGLRDATNGHW